MSSFGNLWSNGVCLSHRSEGGHVAEIRGLRVKALWEKMRVEWPKLPKPNSRSDL
jgi:hypothetical protein